MSWVTSLDQAQRARKIALIVIYRFEKRIIEVVVGLEV
jgi:hypothetical protein